MKKRAALHKARRRTKAPARIVVEAFSRGVIGDARATVVYQRELVKCGKKSCRRCTKRPAHGPYWYSYTRVAGRLVSKYIGKNPP